MPKSLWLGMVCMPSAPAPAGSIQSPSAGCRNCHLTQNEALTSLQAVHVTPCFLCMLAHAAGYHSASSRLGTLCDQSSEGMKCVAGRYRSSLFALSRKTNVPRIAVPSSARAVLRRQLGGSGYQPPDGDQTPCREDSKIIADDLAVLSMLTSKHNATMNIFLGGTLPWGSPLRPLLDLEECSNNRCNGLLVQAALPVLQKQQGKIPTGSTGTSAPPVKEAIQIAHIETVRIIACWGNVIQVTCKTYLAAQTKTIGSIGTQCGVKLLIRSAGLQLDRNNVAGLVLHFVEAILGRAHDFASNSL